MDSVSAVRSPSGLYEKKGGSSSSCISASALISVWLGALRWLVDSSATSVTGSGGKFSAYVIFAASLSEPYGGSTEIFRIRVRGK